MIRRVVSAAAVVLLTGVLWPAAVPGAAAGSGGSVVREVVVSTLRPDGGVDRTRVAQLIELAPRAGREATVAIPDAPGLEGYRTLSGFLGPVRTGGELVWRSRSPRDVFALADVDRALPLTVRTRYLLDGKRIDADDLRGRSGRVRIEVTLENVSRRTRTLGYEGVTGPDATGTAPVYLPLEFSVSMDLPVATWHGVEVEHGFVLPAAGVQQVIAPGVLAPPSGERRRTIAIEADADDVLLPAIRVLAFPRTAIEAEEGFGEQVGGLRALYSGLGTIGANLTSVLDGALELEAGLDQLIAGLGRVDEATGKPVVTLGADGNPDTIIGALAAMRDGLRDQLLPALGTIDAATGKPVVTLDASGQPTTVLGALGAVSGGVRSQLLPSIGGAESKGGRGIVVYDEKGNPTTLIGGLQSSQDAYDQQIIPGVSELIDGVDALVGGLGTIAQTASTGALITTDPTAQVLFLAISGGLGSLNPDGTPVVVLGPDGDPATVLAGLGVMRAGLTNPLFELPQAAIGSRTPLDYRLECPWCFDPATPVFDRRMADASGGLDPRFAPGLLQAFKLFSASTANGLKKLHTFDPAKPGLVEGLEQIAGGLETLASKLHTRSAKTPGVVDGVTQVRDGLSTLLGKLRTFDTDDPGFADGLDLVRGGVQQLSQGVFALNDLGLRTVRGQLGDAGDAAALDGAVLAEQTEQAGTHTFLASGADRASTTYVLEIPAQSTAARDDAVRGGLLAATGLGIALLARRGGYGGSATRSGATPHLDRPVRGTPTGTT